MRVVFVSMQTAQHRASGATLRTRRTAERLAARGHDVVWLCAQWWGGSIPEFEQDGVTYRAVVDAEGSAGSFASKLPFALRRASPDVIQVVNTPPRHVTVTKTTARLLRAPVVVDWWADGPDDAIGACGRAATVADAVVTPSELIRTRVREYGAADDDVVVVPESIDYSLVREAATDRRADIVYAHRLDEGCNVESFLLALAELRTQTWRAAVVGDGPLRDRAEEIARDLRIRDRVEFLGDLPPAEFVPVLKGAQVFVQTAAREPFATNLLWALACGCIGIVEYQADSSAHELVEGHERGRCVTSPQAVADAVVDAAADTRLARSEDYAAYDHEAVLDRYLDLYRELRDDYGLLGGLF